MSARFVCIDARFTVGGTVEILAAEEETGETFSCVVVAEVILVTVAGEELLVG